MEDIIKEVKDILIGEVYFATLHEDVCFKMIPIAFINEFDNCEIFYRDLRDKTLHLVDITTIGIGGTKKEAVKNLGLIPKEKNDFFDKSFEVVKKRIKRK